VCLSHPAASNLQVLLQVQPLVTPHFFFDSCLSKHHFGIHNVLQQCARSLFADKVFGPASTTRVVYDVAAQHVVQGAMNGVNGK
jgi:hypothetical protein